MTQKIFLGADHGGYRLKEKIKTFLAKNNIPVEDLSAEFDQKDDYPIVAKQVAKKVAAETAAEKCPTGVIIYLGKDATEKHPDSQKAV